jgi:hypothetical protein
MRLRALYRRILICLLAGLGFGVIISEASYHFLRTGESRAPEVVEINIPPGTAGRVWRGETDPSLPSTLSFVVGDTLLVRNSDTVVHRLGPLIIPPGASSTMKLDSPQESTAACSFQPSKYIGLSVEPPLTVGTRLVGIVEAGIPMGFLFVLYGLFAMPGNKSSPV